MGLLTQAHVTTPSPVDMRSGDIFALISDGFFEYSNGNEEPFGMERIEGFIRAHHQEPLEDLTVNLYEAVRAFAGEIPQEDDMTIVLVRRKPNQAVVGS